MKPLESDRWQGQCCFEKAGRWEYVVEAWGDTFRSWKKTFAVRVQAKDPDVPIEAQEGARLLREAAKRARAAGVPAAATQLEDCADLLTTVALRTSWMCCNPTKCRA
jgi:starch synthase (maltosyl-transferring)